jgi:hypothetical protein
MDKATGRRWVMPTMIVLALISALIGYTAWRGVERGTAPNVPATGTLSDPKHELFYFLTVQKTRDGKPFEAPFKSSGQEVFESGYKFSMVFQPDADGLMYIFNEGKDAQGNGGYSLLFPTPRVNNGSAQVSAGQSIETAQNTFGGGKGTEVMWMIWTKDKRDDLEAVIRSAFTQSGAIRDENGGILKAFLDKYNAEKPDSSKDSTNQRTVVRATGDIVAHRFELEHR